ncbi:hypothetical protein TRFO_10023 [Tritrichomonas foetus]|uniref:E2F/DP family winged-helix DNA-binding domain-containing protein n=1 Tax=Tritrichomonas foetus TaxID=1144522 RepID=A0A1J4JAZ7_9EUKA|nr:hypothetical protein TRFO_10023 [Tritrichomonas foetus]|eukprot:OHS96362.1 hypothetical protein TRFO_10023 [Tritrichomonas foetus]
MKTNLLQPQKPRKNTFGAFVDSIIRLYEDHTDMPIMVNSIAAESGVEKRRLYDLFNVFTACGVCAKSGTHSYVWKGLKNLKNYMSQIARNTELLVMQVNESIACSGQFMGNEKHDQKCDMKKYPSHLGINGEIHENCDMKYAEKIVDALFRLNEGPSIRSITSKFLMYFFFTGNRIVNLRDCATLMGSDEKREKPILRRLYLVAFHLERIGLIKHSQCNAEYEFIGELESIIDETYQQLSANNEYPAFSVRGLLNKIPKSYVTVIQKAREESISRYLAEKRSSYFVEASIGASITNIEPLVPNDTIVV